MLPHTSFPRRRRLLAVSAIAVLTAAVLASAAVAASFALKVAKHAKVTSVQGVTTHPNVVVNSKGRVVYTLTGDSRTHPECVKSNGCLAVWPPVTVKSVRAASKATGIKGKLGTWKRNGFIQLTLNGHPLYTFAGDTQKDVATGEGIQHFGGTWHVVKAAGASSATPAPATPAPSAGGGY